MYYKIWADLIIKLRSIPKNKDIWKFYSITFMSIAMALNLVFLLAIIQRNILGYTFYSLNIDVFPGTKIDAFVSFFIRFLLPFLLLNYFLVFHNRKYEKIISRHKGHNGKLFVPYFLSSLILPLLILWIGILLR